MAATSSRLASSGKHSSRLSSAWLVGGHMMYVTVCWLHSHSRAQHRAALPSLMVTPHAPSCCPPSPPPPVCVAVQAAGRCSAGAEGNPRPHRAPAGRQPAADRCVQGSSAVTARRGAVLG